MTRTITAHYIDPLDAIWLSAAHTLGFRVERSGEVYAAFDGERTLTIGSDETLDADDCLAQMIFHEFCHAIVQGDAHREAPDWGLNNYDERDVIREHACLRLQAVLLAPFGLRQVLAPTTDFRVYYDALGADPLAADAADDDAVQAARLAFDRVGRPPWHPVVADALRATSQILRVVAGINGRDPYAITPAVWELQTPHLGD